MKKKIIICLSLMIFILFLALSLIIKKENDFQDNKVIYAINIVDTSGNVTRQTTFPSKGAYKVDVNCGSLSGKWLYDEWKLQIIGKTVNAKCNLTFTAIAKTTLANKIIGLKNTTQGTGKVVNEPSTDYRYEGLNPNNYVWFNNELWRIIGTFGNNTHGQNGNLVKIIRDESIGILAWDGPGTQNWATSSTTIASSLNKYLNSYYYNNSDASSYTIATSVYKFPGKEIGIKDEYRGMVQQVVWKLGGIEDVASNVATFYSAERGTTVPSGASATYNGYIGLMYPSDYGYSVLSSNCSRTTQLSYYNNSSCVGQSWIYGQGREWTITPFISKWSGNYAVFVYSKVNSTFLAKPLTVRPSLYLKSSVYVVDGDGSITNPYIIMNT